MFIAMQVARVAGSLKTLLYGIVSVGLIHDRELKLMRHAGHARDGTPRIELDDASAPRKPLSTAGRGVASHRTFHEIPDRISRF